MQLCVWTVLSHNIGDSQALHKLYNNNDVYIIITYPQS